MLDRILIAHHERLIAEVICGVSLVLATTQHSNARQSVRFETQKSSRRLC